MNVQVRRPGIRTALTIRSQPRLDRIFLGAVVLQIPLALLMELSSVVATAHALLTLLAGLFVLRRSARPGPLLVVLGYITGSEVLWRMTRAAVFWEYGKYLTVLLVLLAILRWRLPLRPLPLLYFLLLIPGIILTAGGFAFWTVRDEISFNLSGPLALMVAVLFFTHVRIPADVLRRVLLSIIVPAAGIAAIAVYTVLTAPEIYFSTDSNVLTSGGYGPNQVSAILSLGALCAWLYVLIENRAGRTPWLVLAVGLWLLVQAIFTYSRGGVFNFVIAGVVSAGFLIEGNLRRRAGLLMILAVTGAALLLILPRLDEFSQQTLSARFSGLDTTGRTELVFADLALWRENFWFGVGPGGAATNRAGFDAGIASHTEYTRLLSEHGLLGFLSLLILGFISLQRIIRARTRFEKGILLSFLLWSLAEMTHADMRIAAISLLFGMAFANYQESE